MPTFLQNLRLMRPLSFIRRRPYFVQCRLYFLVHRQYPGNVCSARLCFNHIVLQQNCLQTQQLLFLYCIQYCVRFLESTPGIVTQRKWLFAQCLVFIVVPILLYDIPGIRLWYRSWGQIAMSGTSNKCI